MTPLVRAACVFAAGALFGLRVTVPDAVPLLLLTVTGVLACIQMCGGFRPSSAMVLFLFAGAATGMTRAAQVRGDCRGALPDGAAVSVRGWVENMPYDGSSVMLRARSVRHSARTIDCRGPLRVRLPPGRSAPAPGSEVVYTGHWWAAPVRGDWPEPPERRGTLAARAQNSPSQPRAAPLLVLRGRAQARVRELFPEPSSGYAEALLLAQRDGLDAEISLIFAQSGLSHLLAISGTHVALVAATLVAGARVARLSTRVGALLAALGTTAYVVLLGAPHAAARSLLQILLLLVARLAQRPADAFTLMAAAGLLLISNEPLALLDAGFQLSFAGVFGLIAFTRNIARMFPERMPHGVKETLATSIAATATTTPIVAFHFGLVSVIAVAANLVAIPAVSLAVPAIACTLAAGALSLPLGRFLAAGAAVPIHLLDRSARFAAALPGSHVYVDRGTVLAWLLASAAALVVGSRLRHRLRSARAGKARARRHPIAVLGAAAAAAFLVVALPLAGRGGSGALEIHAIDVGQGDALAIRTPAGHWLLVDTGPRSASFDAGRSRVVPFLLRRGVRRIDVLILTHPDADHIGGAEAVLGAVRVGAVIDPALPAGKDLYIAALRRARSTETVWYAARAGRELRIDNVSIRFLAPDESQLDANMEANDYSVVFRLAWGRFGALFLGDAPASVENELVARHGATLAAEVLKVGHHGSRTSTGDSLLAVVQPRVGLVSAGLRNRYGHPDPLILQRLAKHGVAVLRTDRQGTLTVRVDAAGRVQLATER
jgi:competence protein ComEC